MRSQNTSTGKVRTLGLIVLFALIIVGFAWFDWWVFFQTHPDAPWWTYFLRGD